MKILKDFNEKWYFLGTIVGILAGITIGWFMFYSPEENIIVVEEPSIIDTTTVVTDWEKDSNVSENKKIYYDYLYDKKNSTSCDEKIYAD
jgi:hypothetical protein